MGSGFSLDAINVVRTNRSLLKKRKFRDLKRLLLEESGKTELEFKQVSPIELKRIKDKIRNDSKKLAKREILVYGIITILLLTLATLPLIFLF